MQVCAYYFLHCLHDLTVQLCYSINPAMIPIAKTVPIVMEIMDKLEELSFSCVAFIPVVQFPERPKMKFAKSKSDVSSLLRPPDIRQSLFMYFPNPFA